MYQTFGIPERLGEYCDLHRYDPRLSPVSLSLIKALKGSLGKLALRKPVRRFVFDGPLVFTNFYRQD